MPILPGMCTIILLEADAYLVWTFPVPLDMLSHKAQVAGQLEPFLPLDPSVSLIGYLVSSMPRI